MFAVFTKVFMCGVLVKDWPGGKEKGRKFMHRAFFFFDKDIALMWLCFLPTLNPAVRSIRDCLDGPGLPGLCVDLPCVTPKSQHRR